MPSSNVHFKTTGEHQYKLDYGNLQFEKGGWSKLDAFSLSKLLQVMMTRGIFLQE